MLGTRQPLQAPDGKHAARRVSFGMTVPYPPPPMPVSLTVRSFPHPRFFCLFAQAVLQLDVDFLVNKEFADELATKKGWEYVRCGGWVGAGWVLGMGCACKLELGSATLMCLPLQPPSAPPHTITCHIITALFTHSNRSPPSPPFLACCTGMSWTW